MRQRKPHVRSLIRVSLDHLATAFRVEKGLFAKSMHSDGRIYGVSERYSLISIIGLHRAEESGYLIDLDLESILDGILAAPPTNLSDAGLRLWASSCIKLDRSAAIRSDLVEMLDCARLPEQTGMAMGVALSGLVAHDTATGEPSTNDEATRLRDYILAHYTNRQSGLFSHVSEPSARSRLPNFATQIYLMHGLANHSSLTGDPKGADAGVRCARTLSALQRNDGGWPWIYSVTGSVVEDYEIYSVHQDAMAPMAFLALMDASGESLDPLIDKGLNWLDTANALGIDMVDAEAGLIYRSLRLRPPWARFMLAVNSASSLVAGSSPLHGRGPVELNATCRPYHAGWVLEAWASRYPHE